MDVLSLLTGTTRGDVPTAPVAAAAAAFFLLAALVRKLVKLVLLLVLLGLAATGYAVWHSGALG